MFNRLQVEYQSLSASSSDLNLLPFASKTFFPFCLRQQLFFKQFYSFFPTLWTSFSLFYFAAALSPVRDFLSSPSHPPSRRSSLFRLHLLIIFMWQWISFSSVHSPPLILLARFYTMFSFLLCKAEKKSDCERICLKRRNFHCWCWCVGESLSRLQPLSESSFVGCHHKNEKRGAEDERKESGFYETLRCLSLESQSSRIRRWAKGWRWRRRALLAFHAY